MSGRITTNAIPKFEKALQKFSQPEEVVAWDIFWVQTQQPNGQVVPMLQFFVAAKSPLLGQGPVAFGISFDPALNTQEQINEVTFTAVGKIREICTRILRDAN